MPTRNSQLWSLLQGRDFKGAALYLVSTHADEVLALCRGMVRDESLAEDLSQDVFGRAFAALPEFRGEASSRTWILRIARNRCIDHLRAQAREPLAGEEVSVDEEPAPEPRVDDLLAARVQVRMGLDALGENERALVMLRFGHGLEYAELADTFGLNEAAARMRVSRAVAKMRAALASLTPLSRSVPRGAAGSAGAPRSRRRAVAPAAPLPPAAPAPAAPMASAPGAPSSSGGTNAFGVMATVDLRRRLEAMARS